VGLYERLLGTEEPPIDIHQFYGMMADRRRNKITSQQIIDHFALDATAQSELATLVTRMSKNLVTALEIHEVLMAGQAGAVPYDTVAEVKTRFGV
jgi:hypothetical protein